MDRTRKQVDSKFTGPETGFTLLELLLALLVSSIVLLGVSGVLQSSANAHKRVSNTRLLQEDAGYGATLLRQQLAQIGYRSVNRALLDTRRLPVAELHEQFPAVDGKWLDGQTIKGDASSLEYRYSGATNELGNADGSILNCIGAVSYTHLTLPTICSV